MKNYIKKMLPAIIIAFSFIFMLFIYEPIIMYSASPGDFWFSFNVLIKSNILFFIGTFLLLFALSSIVYLISVLLKKNIIYKIYLMLFSSGFIFAYLQGNYFSKKLPLLDGSPIIWNNYSKESVISYVLIVTVLLINIILLLKFKETYKKIISYVSVSILIMLTAGLIPILINNKELYQKKGMYISTTNNINVLSKNKNFLILLVDMLDSRTFDKVLKDNDKEYLFKDFTYYPDTLATYPFTRESIPFILSGKWYEAKTPYQEYYNDALDNSSFLKTLRKDGYDINIYEQELQWTSKNSLKTKNYKNINNDLDIIRLFKEESKYIRFKYLPFSLKKYSMIESMDFITSRKPDLTVPNIFLNGNKEVYDILDNIEVQKNNYFQFVHIAGGHYPWDMNKDFEKIENGTYEEKIESAITVIEKYLNRIKKSGQYDNSVIIILADHGNNGYDPVGRQNPSLYIKGFSEKHDKINISDKKVSYTDLNDSIYSDLLNGKKSNELLKNNNEKRVRRFIWYKDYDKMYEQTLDGHAWETKKLKNTGKRYER